MSSRRAATHQKRAESFWRQLRHSWKVVLIGTSIIAATAAMLKNTSEVSSFWVRHFTAAGRARAYLNERHISETEEQLLRCVQDDDYGCVKAFLDSRNIAVGRRRTPRQDSALSRAAKFRRIEIARLLVDAGARTGDAFVHLISEDNVFAVSQLCEWGMDGNAPDSFTGSPPLCYLTTTCEATNSLAFLNVMRLRCGVKLNVTCPSSNSSPLTLAAQTCGSPDFIQALVRYAAAPDAKDPFGRSAQDGATHPSRIRAVHETARQSDTNARAP
ncbi:hypothetical protein AMOR_47230 [Anaeromyxobacter oryzae]|uniref:Ankyrin n=1 Tax=Anaeromyxobacter oryzae TaxID=2918170 RepID=A0ABM7X1R8_9BACT|nr:hypothetical protein AMOR_47230 [Anaeromyxobacter oryzae]